MRKISGYLLHIVFSIALLPTMLYLTRFLGETPENLTITMSGRFLHTDIFQLFYVSGDNAGFSEQESLLVNINGSPDEQTVTMNIPMRLKVKDLRLDLGTKPAEGTDQEEFRLSKLSLSNGSVEYLLQDSLSNCFSFNGVTVAPDSHTLVAKTTNGVYDPFIAGRTLGPALEALQKPVKPSLSLLVFVTYWATLVLFIFITIPPITKNTSVIQVSFTCVFIALLVLPTGLLLSGDRSSVNTTEKRTLASFPKLSWSREFARNFERYFDDNFGLRSSLVRTGGLLKVKVFGVAMRPEQAMLGNDGFIFYNNSDGADMIFNSYTHRNLLKSEDVALFGKNYEGQVAWCRTNNIVFLKGFWPNKETIYQDKLPFQMKIQIRDTVSKADQIVNHIRDAYPQLKYIDVRSVLMDQKKVNQIYCKLDTHWNHLGAYYAYKSMFELYATELGIKPFQLDDFIVEWSETGAGDLLDFIGLGDKSGMTEQIPSLRLKNSNLASHDVDPGPYPNAERVLICENCSDTRRLVVFGDSYTVALMQFYSLHFREVIMVRSGFDQSIVEQLKPNVVIHTPVERLL